MQIVILTSDVDKRRSLRYLGPYQIAWWMRENGYEVQVLDMIYFLSKEQRLSLYKKYITSKTKVIAYSPFVMLDSSQKNKSVRKLIWEILMEIKILFPHLKIVVGGQIVRDFEKLSNSKIPFKVDAIFRGDSENSFLEYCNHLFKGEKPPFYEIDANGNKIITSKPGIFDIQSCNMKFSENDFILPNEALPFELSRGCIFKCKFCQYPNIGKNKNDFNKSMSCVRESLISNYKLFGTTKYHMCDDTFNSHRERTKQFCEMVKTLPFKIQYIGYMRLDLLSIWPEQVEMLPNSGLISSHFGIESFDPYSCNIIGKGWGAKNHKKYLNYICQEWGDDVIIKCSMICGLGKETKKEWNESNEWLLQSKIHDWAFNYLDLKPDLGLSEFEKDPSKYGYKFNDCKWYNDYNTFDEAFQFSRYLNKETENVRIPSVWDLLSHMNLNYDLETIKKTSYKEFEQLLESGVRFQSKVNAYYDKAINY